jgi:hypothetical protein
VPRKYPIGATPLAVTGAWRLPHDRSLRSLMMIMMSRAGLIAIAALVGGCGGGALERDASDAAPNDDAGADEPLPPLDGATAGYALTFDGVDDYATAGNGGFVSVAEAMTIEMWVNFESGATEQDFVVLRLDRESGVRVGIYAGTIAVRRVYVDRVLVQAPALPSASTWHHVAYTSDWYVNTLYIDGVQVDAQMTTTDNRTPDSVWLGTIDGTTALFRGKMDEVRVWSVTRSADEVRLDMRRGPAAHTDGLLAYWTFDDDRPGGRSLDSSGLQNDVTLGDGVTQRMPARVPSDAPTGN